MQGSLGRENQRRLLDAIIHIGSELDLAPVLRRIVEVATELVDANYGALGVLDETRTHLAEFQTVGMPDDQVDRIGEPPKGHGILGVLIVDPRPLRLPDLTKHPDSFGFPLHHPPMTSLLGVPIIVRGEAFGNLYLCDKRDGGVFSSEDEVLVVALASAAAMAIDNARLHSRVCDLARNEDRERIARDLHDTVIQRVFAVGLGLQQAMLIDDLDEVRERIDTAIDELDETAREVRSAIFELKAVERSTRTLRELIASTAAEAARVLGFEPTVTLTGPVNAGVSEERAVHVIAVIREALSNVARHAEATAVTITLSVGDGHLSLTVVDDGVGVTPGEIGGQGLSNMEGRAARFGGSMLITPATPQGSGTRVTWSIPLED
ncbi:MAG: GAF domain-containing sensor histidine kinase [Microthrixaceae bacterium]|nr:GAF domain-containing sensor histidine kinase [Microthrixaceae bacterium]